MHGHMNVKFVNAKQAKETQHDSILYYKHSILLHVWAILVAILYTSSMNFVISRYIHPL
jgi:hypothetical protein